MGKSIKTRIEASGRHVHLSRKDAETLFGEGFELEVKAVLGDGTAGQFLSTTKLELKGPKGSLMTSVLGPFRKETQIELSYTEARSIGLRPIISDSGKLEGTSPITIAANGREVDLKRGVMVARRHVHMTQPEAEYLGVKNDDMVVLRTSGERGLVFENVIVHIAPADPAPEYSNTHLDYDEWNAAGLQGGFVKGEIFRSVKDIED